MTKLIFQENQINTIIRDGVPYMTARQIGLCLGKDSTAKLAVPHKPLKSQEEFAKDNVNRIYNRHAEEFSLGMTRMAKINGNFVRIFSPRAVYLIAMFSNAPRAKEFRKWVLDVLEEKVSKQQNLPLENPIQKEKTVLIKDTKTSMVALGIVEAKIHDLDCVLSSLEMVNSYISANPKKSKRESNIALSLNLAEGKIVEIKKSLNHLAVGILKNKSF